MLAIPHRRDEFPRRHLVWASCPMATSTIWLLAPIAPTISTLQGTTLDTQLAILASFDGSGHHKLPPVKKPKPASGQTEGTPSCSWSGSFVTLFCLFFSKALPHLACVFVPSSPWMQTPEGHGSIVFHRGVHLQHLEGSLTYVLLTVCMYICVQVCVPRSGGEGAFLNNSPS